MGVDDVIKQLESLIKDRRSFLEEDKDNDIFLKDIAALKEAINIIADNADMDRIGVSLEVERSLNIDINVDNTIAVLTERIICDKNIKEYEIKAYNDKIDLLINLLKYKKIKIININ